ncbi:MAG: PDZ domain-containing protein [Vicinamibacterales bacterium]
MKGWKVATLAAALTAAPGIGAAIAPAAEGQARIVRAQSPRAVEVTRGGSRIGVSVRDLEDADAKSATGASSGVIVEEVTADSPAEKAGIRKNDVLVEFDGERVRSVRQLTRLVQETPSGRSVQAALLRDGQRSNVTVAPREGNRFDYESFQDLREWARDLPYRVAPKPPRPPKPPAGPVPPEPPDVWAFEGFLGRSTRLGITVDSLSSQLAEYFGAKEGVLVTSVSDGSAAAKAGLKAGDVITAINGTAVDEPVDLRRRIQDLNDDEEFTIAVMRDRKPVTLKGKAERPERRRTARTIL